MIASLTILAAFFALLALAAWAADREPVPEREDRRLTEDEMALTGPDYREKVNPLYDRHREWQAIIEDVCGVTRGR